MDSPKLLELEVGRCQLLEHEDVKIRNPLGKTCIHVASMKRLYL